MTSPVITAEDALELNRRAQAIDPILFWTCNYEPTRSYAISEDALFLTGIQDLYKFAIDANCVMKGFAFDNDHCVCPGILSKNESERLKATFNVIKTLRAAIDHNQSELNGSSTSQNKAFSIWVQGQLGKDQPSSQEDFEVLNQTLKEMGEYLVTLSEQIIDRIARKAECEEIASKWVEKILNWYSTWRQEYYRGLLCDYYVARASSKRAHFASIVKSYDLHRKINGWIGRQTTMQFDQPLRDLRIERDGLQDALDNPPDAFLRIKEACPDLYEETICIQKARIEQINTEESRLEAARDEFNQMHRGKKIDYFFEPARLKEQLHETLQILGTAKEPLTLLPQDFLQLDIERNFADVRSPEKDF